MDASKKQREPVAFKSLAELKRFIRPGVEFKTVSHANHADMVGLTRVVTTVQTVGFYSKIKDQPEHPFSTCNHGKGFYTDFGKAGNYIFDGTTVKVKDNGRGLSLVPGEDDFSVVKPQKLKLYMPLELGYYEKNDWGDYGDEELALSDNDAVGYADTITGALERESKFLDTPRGFMEYYNRSDGVDAKVQSLYFKAEARDGKLWGVAECMVSGELTGEELDNLKLFVGGQASDGFGESVEQHEIRVGNMELYAHLWQPVDWRIQTEQERFEQEQTGGMTLAQSM